MCCCCCYTVSCRIVENLLWFSWNSADGLAVGSTALSVHAWVEPPGGSMLLPHVILLCCSSTIQMLSVSQSAKHHTHDLKCCPSYKIDIYNQFITAHSLNFTKMHFVIVALTSMLCMEPFYLHSSLYLVHPFEALIFWPQFHYWPTSLHSSALRWNLTFPLVPSN